VLFVAFKAAHRQNIASETVEMKKDVLPLYNADPFDGGIFGLGPAVLAFFNEAVFKKFHGRKGRKGQFSCLFQPFQRGLGRGAKKPLGQQLEDHEQDQQKTGLDQADCGKALAGEGKKNEGDVDHRVGDAVAADDFGAVGRAYGVENVELQIVVFAQRDLESEVHAITVLSACILP